MKKVPAAFLAILLMFTACSGKVSPSVDDQLVNAYSELARLSEEYKQSPSALTRQQFEGRVEEILKKHDMTRQQFASRYQALSEDKKEFQEFCDEVVKKIQEQRTKP